MILCASSYVLLYVLIFDRMILPYCCRFWLIYFNISLSSMIRVLCFTCYLLNF